jgi:glycerophosphoryl diester phosphodiesterase
MRAHGHCDLAGTAKGTIALALPACGATVLSFLKHWSELFRLFFANWRHFLVVHFVVNALVFVVLAPLATVLLNLAVTLSGDAALSDQDIIFFLLSPIGLVSMLIIASLFSIILFLEHAALMTLGYHETDARKVTGPWLLAFLGKKAASLFRLSFRILLRVILTLLPFLLLLSAVYFLLLGEFDINYYLSERPAEFRQAVILGTVIGIALFYFMLRLAISWVFCLPFLLIDDLSPAQALEASREAVRGKRINIAGWLLSWLVFSFLASVFMTGLIGLIGASLIPLAVNSFAALLIVLSVIALFSAAVNFALTLCTGSLLSLLILRLFRDLNLQHKKSSAPGEHGKWRLVQYLSWRHVAWASVAAVLIATLFINALLDRVDLEDRTEVMAHRGASGMAPENTMAAIQAAIDSGADWVEIDVQETADGAIVVIHDSDLKKIAGNAMKVADSTLTELQQLDIGSWFGPEFADQRILTLKQVLQQCEGKIGVNIELKYYGKEKRLEESVAGIVEATGMQDQVLLMSLSHQGIKKMRSIRPDWEMGLLSSVALGNIIGLDVDFLALNAKSTSSSKIHNIHKRNKKVMVWTVNDAVGMSVMFSRGVDAIITDEPALAVSVLRQRMELNPAERMLVYLADVFDQPSMYQEQ